MPPLRSIRWLFPSAGLIFCLAAARADDVRSVESGYSILDVPEAHGSFVNGSVMSLARTDDGVLFVGSNRLAAFDGRNWQRIDVPGVSRFLTLTVENRPGPAGTAQRVWIGGDGPMGYVDRGPDGRWSFTALRPREEPAEKIDIRQVEPDGRGGATFVARTHVLHWDGERFTTWNLPNASRLFPFLYRRRLHVFQPGTGLYRIEDSGPRLVLAEADLPVRDPLVGLVEAKDGADLAVFFDEVCRRRGDTWTRLPALSAILRGRRAMFVARMDGDQVAIGTAYGGVLICRTDGTFVGLVNSQTGSPDNNVDSLLGDGPGRLWIGTGTSLVRVLGPGYASLFDERVRLASSVIRRVLALGDHSVVITSRRAYELSPTAAPEPTRFNRVETLWPQLRDGMIYRGELWLAGTGGLWRLEGSAAVQELAVGGDVSQMLAPASLPDELLFFEGTDARALVGAGGAWRTIDLGQRLESVPVSSVEDAAGRIWVATDAGRVHVFKWGQAGRQLQVVADFRPGQGLPVGTQRPLLVRFGGAVCAFTETEILSCPDLDRGFVPLWELAGFVAEAAVGDGDGRTYWVVQHTPAGPTRPHALIELRPGAGASPARAIFLDAPGLNHIGDVTSVSLTGEGARRVLWVGGTTALLRLEAAPLGPAEAAPATKLQRLRYDGTSFAPVTGLASPTPFPPSVGRMEFSFAAGAGHSDCLYETWLAGVENGWSRPQLSSQREFTGLPPGSYTFLARAVDRFGRPGLPLRYAFIIAAPWYFRPWAIALWVLGAGLLISAGVRWRLHRLERQAERLNQLVTERTRELSLSHTTRAEFLDNLSHEIQRPLNGIIAITRRLEQDELTAEQRARMQQLRLGGESLSRVLNDVLNFSRLEFGAVPLAERPFRLGELLAAVLAECQAGSPSPVLRLPADFADGFIGDDGKLKTIIANFVDNALKHAAGAPVEIAASCVETGPGAVKVLVEVADGGPGIPAEEQELIFKRFVRGSQAKQERVPGSGVGLATCRVMARLMGGGVGVGSPAELARERGWPGAGATFFVLVPLRRDPAAPRPA